MRALVLAAGLGRRLGRDSKPLSPVAGRPLLLHVLDRLAAAGIADAVVVLGHRAADVQAGVLAGNPALRVAFVQHGDFTRGNGCSVLAAANRVPPAGAVLIMGDHLHAPSTIEDLVLARPVDTTVVVDPNLSACPDLAEATKVETDAERVVAIGKQLAVFDSIDTGLFWIRRELVDALADVRAERGDCTLSEGMSRLAAQHRVGARTLATAWLDTDTPADLARAESLLRDERSGKVLSR